MFALCDVPEKILIILSAVVVSVADSQNNSVNAFKRRKIDFFLMFGSVNDRLRHSNTPLY